MPFTVVSNGLIARDTFERGDSATVGNDWDETVRGTGAMKIESNNLDSGVTSGVEQVVKEGHVGGPIEIPVGDTIVQINGDMSLAGGDRCQIMVRTNEKVAGTGSESSYLAYMSDDAQGLAVYKYLAGAVDDSALTTWSVGNSTRTLRLVLEDNGSSHVVTALVSEWLIDTDDLTKDFTAATPATITDSVSPIEATGDTTDVAILTVDDVHMRNHIVMGRGVTVTGLPTGYKVSGNQGVTKVTESGGSATINVDALALPIMRIGVYSDGDVLQDVDTPDADAWGGATVAWTATGETTEGDPTDIDWAMNFRSTVGYITDGANQYHLATGDEYPQTRGGLTCGWDEVAFAASISLRDRDNVNDVRLAGAWEKANTHAVPNALRIDLPNGFYDVSLAAGDHGSTVWDMRCYVADSGLPRISIDTTVDLAPDSYWDAEETEHTESTWVSTGADVKVRIEITTGIMRVILGGTGEGTGHSRIAHFRIEGVAPVVAGGAGGTGGATRGIILRRRRRLER